jgi:hypothetical protein
MEPAYHIPLTDTELRLIGETCAIQGQIEYLMQNMVGLLLDTEHEATMTIMGSTSIHTNADVWLSVIIDKCNDAQIIEAARQIKTDMGEAVKGRNDFVHALFATTAPDGGGFMIGAGPIIGGGTPVAIRTKGRKQRAASDIQGVRDRAAKISRAMAHINHCLRGVPAARSPWRDK